MESLRSLTSECHDRNIPKVLEYVQQKLEGTPEYGLNDYLHDEDSPVDDAIRTLCARGLTYADVEKARRWNQMPMYAAHDAAQFKLLLAALKSIGIKHSQTELKQAFLHKHFEAKARYPQHKSKPEILLQALETHNADESTLAFCRDALQGRIAAQDAATRFVEVIVKQLGALNKRKPKADTQQEPKGTRAGIRKQPPCKVKKQKRSGDRMR
jgi:hypothetical protein